MPREDPDPPVVPEEVDPDEILPEYDLAGAVRGTFATRYAEGSNVVVLDPDVARVFRTSQSVNEALRALVRIIEEQQTHSAA